MQSWTGVLELGELQKNPRTNECVRHVYIFFLNKRSFLYSFALLDFLYVAKSAGKKRHQLSSFPGKKMWIF